MTMPKPQIDRKDVELASLRGFREGVDSVTRLLSGRPSPGPKSPSTSGKKRGPKGPWKHNHTPPVEMNKAGKSRRHEAPAEPNKAA